jgi:predicted phosphodiesterase
MASYIVAEQDTRLQSILDENKNVIFLSGHTHVSPSIEFDGACGNLYINDGSVCPTTIKGTDTATQQGNVTLLEISKAEISVIIKGIHSEKVFIDEHIATDWSVENE